MSYIALVGMGGMGHIYAEVIASDIELKACFGSPSRGQQPNAEYMSVPKLQMTT